MPTRKAIPAAERRRQDYLRRQTLKVGSVYEARLAKARRKELRRVLGMALDLSDPDQIPGLMENIEEDYLYDWWAGLWITAGVPQAKAVAASLRQAKAAGETDLWGATLRRYALKRAGENISVVSGTWKTSLVNLIQTIMAVEKTAGVEKLTRLIYRGYREKLEKWQCRRIAQTESMIGMAEAGAVAAGTLDVPFTKQWCVSGLGNTRPSHEAMDGVIVDENEPFELEGGLLLYPHDTSMGADAGEIINCACCCVRRPKDTAQETVRETVRETVEVTEDPDQERIQAMMDEMPDILPEETRRAIARNNLDLEKALAIKKGAPMTISGADEQSANPKYIPMLIKDPEGVFLDTRTGERFSKNPKYSGANKRYHINCATCTPAYELRRRGFDVKAKGKIAGKGDHNDWISRGNSYEVWKNADGSKAKPTLLRDYMSKNYYLEMTEARYEKFLEESTKEEGRYEVLITWKGGGGHATVLERKKNGDLVYIEPQAYDADKGVERSIKSLSTKVGKIAHSKDGVMRLDDKIFDTKYADLFNVK